MTKTAAEVQTPADNATVLTQREMQVALMLATGEGNRAIAKRLDISIKTIDTHRQHIMKKLGLANNVRLCLHALRQGWIDRDGAALV